MSFTNVPIIETEEDGRSRMARHGTELPYKDNVQN